MSDYNITTHLAAHIDLYRWEQHLSAAQQHQLAFYRAVAAEDKALEDAFYVELQAKRESRKFLEALDEAGDDPVARAEVFYFLHLDAYPFWLSAGGTDEAELPEPMT